MKPRPKPCPISRASDPEVPSGAFFNRLLKHPAELVPFAAILGSRASHHTPGMTFLACTPTVRNFSPPPAVILTLSDSFPTSRLPTSRSASPHLRGLPLAFGRLGRLYSHPSQTQNHPRRRSPSRLATFPLTSVNEYYVLNAKASSIVRMQCGGQDEFGPSRLLKKLCGVAISVLVCAIFEC
jgi:hypothetical protein